MTISERRAKELIFAEHQAWNDGDIDRLIALYHDDFVYWNNMVGPDGEPLTIAGKDAIKEFLEPFIAMKTLTVPEDFRLEDGRGHVTAEFVIKDPKTGHTHSATYRQVVFYKDDLIVRLEEYHDAGVLAAFLGLLDNENG